MGWSLFRRSVLLTLSVTWLFVSVVQALHADEAGVIDWHHKLIGTPLQGSTFLHKPVIDSGSLAFTLTDRNVLAALSLRDGAIIWRQLIDDPKLARPVDGSIAVLSGVDETVVATFDAQTGHQLGQSAKFAGAPLDIEILSPDWPDDNTRDIVTLSSNGFIRRFHHHELAWEATSTNVKGEPRYIATSLSKIYVVYVLPRGRSMSIAVATLDAVSGTMIDIHQLDSNLDSAADIQVIGSHSSAPLAIWSEKGKIKANILGSKPVVTLPTETEFTSFSALAPHSSTSLPHFLVSYSNDFSSWAQVYHINLSTGSITSAYSLPKGPKGPYSIAQVDANIYFAKVTLEEGRNEADFEVWGSVSHARLARWTIPFPVSTYGLAGFGVLDVVSRGDAVAARAMITASDGSIHLLRNNEHSWTREESLAHTIPSQVLFVDLPVKEPTIPLNVSSTNLLAAYITRLTTHIAQLRDLPSGLVTFARHFATGKYEEIEPGSLHRDAFGLRKFVVVATETGKILALDSASGGNIVWARLFSETKVWGMWIVRESGARRGAVPVVGVLLEKEGLYSFVTVNGLDGEVLAVEEVGFNVEEGFVKGFIVPGGVVDTGGEKVVVLVSERGNIKAVPTNLGKDVLSQVSEKLFYSVQESDGIQGYVVTSFSKVQPTWRLEVPPGSQLISLSSRTPDEKVASIGRVLGDRSVLYKYLNPHLLVAAISNPTELTVTIYLIDNVSGQIVYQTKHHHVDISKGIHTQLAENVVYWTYYSTGAGSGDSRGYRITVAELYESPQPNQKYNTSKWTSFDDKIPSVEAKTYLFPHPITSLTTTTTRHGITSRDLLLLTPHQLLSLPHRLLDPRRPLLPSNGKLTTAQKEEGLIPYESSVPDDRKWTLSHRNELFGLVRVVTSAAVLESTSLVLGVGLDLFWTRVAPSGEFDVLSEGFSRGQLLATIAALGVGLVVMRPLVRRKALRQRWGE